MIRYSNGKSGDIFKGISPPGDTLGLRRPKVDTKPFRDSSGKRRESDVKRQAVSALFCHGSMVTLSELFGWAVSWNPLRMSSKPKRWVTMSHTWIRRVLS